MIVGCGWQHSFEEWSRLWCRYCLDAYIERVHEAYLRADRA